MTAIIKVNKDKACVHNAKPKTLAQANKQAVILQTRVNSLEIVVAGLMKMGPLGNWVGFAKPGIGPGICLDQIPHDVVNAMQDILIAEKHKPSQGAERAAKRAAAAGKARSERNLKMKARREAARVAKRNVAKKRGKR